MLKEKGFGGFPALAFMDAEGNVLLVQRDRSVKGFEKSLAALTEWDDVQKRLAKGEKGLEFASFVADWKMGKLDFDAATSRSGALKNLNPAQKATVAQVLLDAEVRQLAASGRTEQGFEASAKRCLAILKAGKPMPSEDSEEDFWMILITKADMDPPDAALYEQAVAALDRIFANRSDRKAFLEKIHARLAELKKPAGT